jgi:hypothetical protein
MHVNGDDAIGAQNIVHLVEVEPTVVTHKDIAGKPVRPCRVLKPSLLAPSPWVRLGSKADVEIGEQNVR